MPRRVNINHIRNAVIAAGFKPKVDKHNVPVEDFYQSGETEVWIFDIAVAMSTWVNHQPVEQHWIISTPMDLNQCMKVIGNYI